MIKIILIILNKDCFETSENGKSWDKMIYGLNKRGFEWIKVLL